MISKKLLYDFFTNSNNKYLMIHQRCDGVFIKKYITFIEYYEYRIKYLRKYKLTKERKLLETYIYEYISGFYDEKYGFFEFFYIKDIQDFLWFYSLYNENDYKDYYINEFNPISGIYKNGMINFLFYDEEVKQLFIKNGISYLRSKKIKKINESKI